MTIDTRGAQSVSEFLLIVITSEVIMTKIVRRRTEYLPTSPVLIFCRYFKHFCGKLARIKDMWLCKKFCNPFYKYMIKDKYRNLKKELWRSTNL